MKSAIAAIPLLFVGSSMAAPLEKRACPNVHIFGARETTAPAGYGSAGTVINLILNAHPGSTAEVINYPAAGGDSYASSVQAGVKAVTNQINSFAASCPNTQLVYVGYSQGAQIGDDALCGGGDPNQGISSTAATISSSVGSKIKAIIFMGDPRQIPGASYSVGTSKNPGVCIFRSRPWCIADQIIQFDPRPSGFTCSAYASRIQAYCDAADPYCSNGNNAATHQGYGSEYGQAALKFVNSKLT
ncbi:acetylxylan esterase precursor [Aureobasidium pullulans]|nr:acetylxylan esterase precursor [Aureobasidium pullulans]